MFAILNKDLSILSSSPRSTRQVFRPSLINEPLHEAVEVSRGAKVILVPDGDFLKCYVRKLWWNKKRWLGYILYVGICWYIPIWYGLKDTRSPFAWLSLPVRGLAASFRELLLVTTLQHLLLHHRPLPLLAQCRQPRSWKLRKYRWKNKSKPLPLAALLLHCHLLSRWSMT